MGAVKRESIQNRKMIPIGFQAGAGAKNLTRSAELQLRMRRRISRVLREETVEEEDAEGGPFGGALCVLGTDAGDSRLGDRPALPASGEGAAQQSYSSMCLGSDQDQDPQEATPGREGRSCKEGRPVLRRARWHIPLSKNRGG